jgi:thymidylate synthase
MAYQSVTSMRYPIVTNPRRAMDMRFAAAEALWIIRGDNKLSTLDPFSKMIKKFSDDGVILFGAYGPKVVAQIDYVVDTLAKLPESRQAVINIWRENPPASKDIPCTLSVQWLVRDGQLYCIDTMRSSDVWMGWVYDVFSFSCLSMVIALRLRQRGLKLRLGRLVLNAGSQHIYQRDWANAEECLHGDSMNGTRTYEPMDTERFHSEGEFVHALECLCGYRNAGSEKPWGKEFARA